MRTTLEITFKSDEKPKLVETSPGNWRVTTEIKHVGAPNARALWVRTFDPDGVRLGATLPKDGKGFLLTPRRKLKVG
jgi:hypothetical protein